MQSSSYECVNLANVITNSHPNMPWTAYFTLSNRCRRYYVFHRWPIGTDSNRNLFYILADLTDEIRNHFDKCILILTSCPHPFLNKATNDCWLLIMHNGSTHRFAFISYTPVSYLRKSKIDVSPRRFLSIFRKRYPRIFS